MNKRILVGVAFFFGLGIVVFSKFPVPFLSVYVSAAAGIFFAILVRRSIRGFCFFLSAAIFFLGAASVIQAGILPVGHVAKLICLQSFDRPVRVTGRVEGSPITRGARSYFFMRAESFQSGMSSYRATGTVIVFLKSKIDLSAGDEAVVLGRADLPRREIKGRAAIIIRVENSREIRVLRSLSQQGFFSFPLKIRSGMSQLMSRHVSPLCGSVLNAMILGDKSKVPVALNDAMMRVGTIHVLVVSGFNVGVVILCAELFLRFVRLKRRLRMLLLIPIVLTYCFMTAGATPVLRATIMALFFLVGRLLKKEADFGIACALAIMVIILKDPFEVFDLGFQLSFASVLSIYLLYPRFFKLFKKVIPKRGVLKWFFEGFLVSFSAWLGTAGIIMANFRIISPVTVGANILIAPLASLITLSGFCLIFVSVFYSALAGAIGTSVECLVSLMIYLNAFFVKLPGGYFYLKCSAY